MKVLLSWLQHHWSWGRVGSVSNAAPGTSSSSSLEAVAASWAEALTHSGTETTYMPAHGWAKDFCVVRIMDAQRHPQADHLQVCQVDAGRDQPLTIVCGASNARPGLWTILAQPGCVLPGAKTPLAPCTLRGVVSQGMLCSAQELALQDMWPGLDGIVDMRALQQAGALDSGMVLVPGMSLHQVLPEDWILDLQITPNRGDLFSHAGIVREMMALHLVRQHQAAQRHCLLPLPPSLEAGGVSDSVADAHVRHWLYPKMADVVDMAGCKEDWGRHDDVWPQASEPLVTVAPEVRDVCVHMALVYMGSGDTKAGLFSSPISLQRCLWAMEQQVHHPCVDITNFMAWDVGQPMHAFDADAVEGPLQIRLSSANESFVGLDDKTYVLPQGLLVTADNQGILALCGVIGAARGRCLPHSQRVLLEAAYFPPEMIAKAVRATGVQTAASTRFERGVQASHPALHQTLYRAVHWLTTQHQAQCLCASVAGAVPTIQPICMAVEQVNKQLGTSFTVPAVLACWQAVGARVHLPDSISLDQIQGMPHLDAEQLIKAFHGPVFRGPQDALIRQKAVSKGELSSLGDVVLADPGECFVDGSDDALHKARLHESVQVLRSEAHDCSAASGHVQKDEERGGHVVHLTPPPWRHDLRGPHDYVEEAARLQGLENIPTQWLGGKPVSLSSHIHTSADAALASMDFGLMWRLRRAMAALGAYEAVTWSLTDQGKSAWFTGLTPHDLSAGPFEDASCFTPKIAGDGGMTLSNPIAQDMDTLRPCVLVTLLDVVLHHKKHAIAWRPVFEIGPAFYGGHPGQQRDVLAAVWPISLPLDWQNGARARTLPDVKDMVYAVLEAAGVLGVYEGAADVPAWYHPGQSVSFWQGDRCIGYAGKIHPRLAAQIDCGPVWMMALTVNAMQTPQFVPTSTKSYAREAGNQAIQDPKVNVSISNSMSDSCNSADVLRVPRADTCPNKGRGDVDPVDWSAVENISMDGGKHCQSIKKDHESIQTCEQIWGGNARALSACHVPYVLPDQQAVVKDISCFLPPNVPIGVVMHAMKAQGPACMTHLALVDVFDAFTAQTSHDLTGRHEPAVKAPTASTTFGAGMSSGTLDIGDRKGSELEQECFRSVTWRMTFQPTGTAFSSEHIVQLMQQVVDVASAYGARLRGRLPV